MVLPLVIPTLAPSQPLPTYRPWSQPLYYAIFRLTVSQRSALACTQVTRCPVSYHGHTVAEQRFLADHFPTCNLRGTQKPTTHQIGCSALNRSGTPLRRGRRDRLRWLYYITVLSGRQCVNGSLIVFGLQFLSALFVGRLWCGWACPAAGLGEVCLAINSKPVSSRSSWVKCRCVALSPYGDEK